MQIKLNKLGCMLLVNSYTLLAYVRSLPAGEKHWAWSCWRAWALVRPLSKIIRWRNRHSHRRWRLSSRLRRGSFKTNYVP